MSTPARFPKVPKGKGLNLTQRRNLKRWLEWLRSDKFVQADASLKTWTYTDSEYTEEEMVIGHCCLGVLCESQGVDPFEVEDFTDKVKSKVKKLYSWDDSRGDEHDLKDAWLLTDSMISPGLLQRWTGLEGDLPEFPVFDGSYAGHLAKLNDGSKSFKQIAAIIERRAEAIHPGWREGI